MTISKAAVLQFTAWVVILVGVWLPWTFTKIDNSKSEAKATIKIGPSTNPTTEITTYGLDTYQGWVSLWLPLLAMTLGAIANRLGKSTGLSQVAV